MGFRSCSSDEDVEMSDDDATQICRFLNPPVCRFFVQRSKGCIHGAHCVNKHLSESGECLRCGVLLRLAEIEQHSQQLCERRQQSHSSSYFNSLGSGRGISNHGRGANNIERGTNKGGNSRYHLPPWNDSDVESSSPSSSRNNDSNIANLQNQNRLCPSSNRLDTSNKSSSNTSIKAARVPKVLWKATNVCRFHLKGCCQYSRGCKFLHVANGKCVLCELPATRETIERHLQECSEYKTLKSEMEKAREVDCPICFCRLSEISPFHSKASHTWLYRSAHINRFALLPDCGHIFCLKCISLWRKEGSREQEGCADELHDDWQEGRYRCPICRKETRFIIPCNRVIEGQERCNREKDIFAHTLRPCRFFPKGNCRKGARCQYAHVGADGLPVAPRQENSRNDTALFSLRDLLQDDPFPARFVASFLDRFDHTSDLGSLLYTGGGSDDEGDNEDDDEDPFNQEDEDGIPEIFRRNNLWNSTTFVLNSRPRSPLDFSSLQFDHPWIPDRTRTAVTENRSRDQASDRRVREQRNRTSRGTS